MKCSKVTSLPSRLHWTVTIHAVMGRAMLGTVIIVCRTATTTNNSPRSGKSSRSIVDRTVKSRSAAALHLRAKKGYGVIVKCGIYGVGLQ
jgi:hypothetical protein